MTPILSSVLLCLLGVGVAHAEAPAPKPEAKLDMRTTELFLRTLAGQATKLDPYAGKKLTLLNLWATWCGPCREEMPALDRLHKKYKAAGFQVVGIDIDETADVVKKVIAKFKVSYPVLLTTPQKTVGELGEIEALPTSILIDETGDVLEILVGAIEVPYLTKIIEQRVGSARGESHPRASPKQKPQK